MYGGGSRRLMIAGECGAGNDDGWGRNRQGSQILDAREGQRSCNLTETARRRREDFWCTEVVEAMRHHTERLQGLGVKE